ncbi:MAG: InlB B-repeat-containing protein [Clostridia bacterium]|nr:InlB B-repeat-containing protein [Clostridia bacterium]
MAKIKRTLSVLLAVVMAFSVCSVAFTASAANVPIVERVASASPAVLQFQVPQYLSTFGTNYFLRGANIKPEGSIAFQLNGTATDVTLTCSVPGLNFSDYTMVGNTYTWTISGGTFAANPSENDTVKFTVSYRHNGKTYETSAWSAVKIVYNDAGVSVKQSKKGTGTGHQTKNNHIEWLTPTYGVKTSTSNCYIDPNAFTHYSCSTEEASAYYWNVGEVQDATLGASYYPQAYYYIDRNVYSGDLSATTLRFGSAGASDHDWDGDHPLWAKGTSVTSQQIKTGDTGSFAATTAYSMQTGDVELSERQQSIRVFYGAVPAADTTLHLVFKHEFEGNIVKDIGNWATYHNDSITYYNLYIVTYDKAELKALIESETSANRQAADFRTAAPTDGGDYSAFRSWNDYYSALQNAWLVYGKENVTQTAINNAIATLRACIPVYSTDGSKWVSGMMYAEADYSAIDTIALTAPSDFTGNTYEDGDYGLYYAWSKAEAVNDAWDDINYDRPLDRRYQAAVDTMKQNLANAITNVKGQYKTFKLVFNANGNDVTSLPAATDYKLFASMAKPSDPSRQYYKFTGWYYDAACTQPVTWPISMNPNANYFVGDLTTKADACGTGVNLYAGWNLTGRTLTFVSNGDTTLPAVIGDEGEHYEGPTQTPTRAGWKFVCWCTDITLQNPVDWSVFTFGASDVTVYGKWERDSFTVTFNSNGGTFASTGTSYSTFTGLYGTAVPEPEIPKLDGYGFAGWYYDSNLSQPIDFENFTVPSSNITVYGQWSDSIRNVVLKTGDGSEDQYLTYVIGNVVYEPTQPTRKGYTFDKWYYNADLTNAVSFPFTMGPDNVTLYAGWNPLQYNVYFSIEADASMADSFNAQDYYMLDCGSVLAAPENPTRKGYVFTGWTYNGEPYTFTTVPAQNITLVASWETEPNTVTYTLRTDVDGNSVQQGDIITATMSIGANHYVGTHSFIVYYDNRYLKPALNGEELTVAKTGTAAVSKEPNKAYFTLIDNPESVKVEGYNIWETAGSITGFVNRFIPLKQYYPAAWLNADGTALKEEYANYEFVYFNAANSKTAPSGGVTIKPDPAQDICSFQFIVLDEAPIADGTTTYAQLLVPSVFTKENDATYGKIIAAYEDAPEFDTAAEYNSTYVLNGADQRFAVEAMMTATVNFVTNSEASIDPVVAKVGRPLELPTPTKAYYDFLGWTLTNDASDTDYVDADAFVVPAEGATLYAKWVGQEAEYKVRHFKQNLTATGWLENYEEETFEEIIGTSVSAVAKDYEGFTCATSDSGFVVGDGSLVLNLYYTRNSSSVTLNANGGTFVNGQASITLSGLFEETVSNPYGDPSRTGYTFKGWQYGASDYTISTYPAEKIALTAKWETNSYTFTFYLNGSKYDEYTKLYGEPVYAPDVTVADGEVFSGWLYNGAEYNFTTMPAQNMEFYATTGIDGFYVTLYIDGVQYGDPIPVTDGAVTADMVAYEAATGYTFSGWLSGNSVVAAPVTFPYELTSDVSFYGFTTHEIYTIEMYYYIDGALEYFDQVSGYYGDVLALPELPDYTVFGYAFDGWYTDDALTEAYAVPATFPAQSLTLYGEWSVASGKIEFNLNGGNGTAPAALEGEIGTTVTLPDGAGLSKQYYKFAGWATTPSGTTAVTKHEFATTETVTYYAIWEVNYATVAFSANGATGTAPESVKAEVGETITLPAQGDLAKDGFVFLGWATTATAKEAIDSYTVASTGFKTLYAVWGAMSVELVAQEGSATVIDNERGYIYGLALEMTEADLEDIFVDVIGNGHIEIEYTGSIGTGAIVKLINDYSGDVDATYEIVIFGDLNGDGIVTATDNILLKGEISGSNPLDAESAVFFAADLNGDGAVTSSDSTTVKGMISGSAEYDQAQVR